VFITLFVVVLLIPLSFTSLRTLRYEQWIKSTETAARQWVKGTGWQVDSVTEVGSEIEIKAIGPGTPPPIGDLRSAVRAAVPRSVAVNVVENSGRTTGL
jgi:hypothetical protein